MKKFDLAVVILLFYFGWFGSVLVAKTAYSSVALLFPIFLVIFLYLKKNLNKKNITFAFAVSLLGILFDSILIHFGLIVAAGTTVLMIPIWLVSIWLLFSFSIIKLGVNLKLPIGLAAVLGMVIGPLSYKSGEIFQVLTFSNSKTFLIYSLFWGLLFPLILNLSKRYV